MYSRLFNYDPVTLLKNIKASLYGKSKRILKITEFIELCPQGSVCVSRGPLLGLATLDHLLHTLPSSVSSVRGYR